MALVHLDAGVVIALLDANDTHHDAARRLLQQCRDEADYLAIAASAAAECMVGAARAGTEVLAVVHRMLQSTPIEVVSIDLDVATHAAELRATHRSLRLPDALVIATAVHHNADRLLTTDRGWPIGAAGHVSVEVV